MESLDNSNDDMGNWCKRLRTRKGSARLSASGQADITDNIGLHQEELSDRKISVRPSPKKQQNQRATDTAKCTSTPQCERNPTPSKPKKNTEVQKASPPSSAPPADICDSLPSGASSSHLTSPQLTENQTGSLPVSTNGVFTCGKCTFHSRDVVTFLQHTHNGTHGLPLNEVSLAAPGLPLKYELDTQTPSKQDYTAKHKAAMARMRKGRKYTWRRKDIKPKVEEEDTSPELKLFLTKHPLKPNSWMARGFLSVEKEILDENGFLLNPEKTIEATNKYLERRTIKEEKSGMKFAIKEELENGSHHSVPVSQLPPRNGTSPFEHISPSSTELALLMERNNISIPPNCTTQVQGFKMVAGKRHLVLKVVPVAGQEPVQTEESSPSPSEHIMSDPKIVLPEDSAQMDPTGSLSERKDCNMISANGTASSCASPLRTTCTPEKPAHVQSEDQGINNEQHQGCFRLRLSLSPDGEPVSENGPEAMIDAVQSAERETEKQEQANEAFLQSLSTVPAPACELTGGLQCDAGQLSEDEAQANADVSKNDEGPSPAVDGFWLSLDSDSDECHGGFPALPPSPSKHNLRPAPPPRTHEEKGKERSHPDDSTSIKGNRECHIPETSGDAALSLQDLDHSPSPQASCPGNSAPLVSVSCPDGRAQPKTELRIVSPPTCTQDAVEHPGGLEPSPQNTERPITNKRPRDSDEGAPDGHPSPKLGRSLDSQEKGVVDIALGDSLVTVQGGSPDTALKGATDGALGGALGDPPHTALKNVGSDSASKGAPPTELGGTPTAAESEHEDSDLRHVVRTLRLFPFNWFQLVTKPEGADQPVVVLNHPDTEIPEVTDIMHVVHNHGSEVTKVLLCPGTLKALYGHRDHEQEQDGVGDAGQDDERSSDASASSGVGGAGPVPRPSPSPGRRGRRRGSVKERFQLKMKLRRSGQNAYQVVNTHGQPQQCLRCWFCGRAFTRQHELISHEQRHVLDNGNWCGWSKTSERP